MTVKTIIDEDFTNYKKPSMLIGMPYCTMKCGADICQNYPLLKSPNTNIEVFDLVKRYIDNNLTQAVVFGGMDPFDSIADLLTFIFIFRSISDDDIVIYTGYTKCEIADDVEELKNYPNIIIKYGRYVPDQEPHYDEVLGVYLASDNQYAEKIS